MFTAFLILSDKIKMPEEKKSSNSNLICSYLSSMEMFLALTLGYYFTIKICRFKNIKSNIFDTYSGSILLMDGLPEELA